MTDEDLASCMLSRAGDLAHYMLQRGITIAVVTGATANGHPCTSIMAIGDGSREVFYIGKEIARRLVDERERMVRDAGKN